MGTQYISKSLSFTNHPKFCHNDYHKELKDFQKIKEQFRPLNVLKNINIGKEGIPDSIRKTLISILTEIDPNLIPPLDNEYQTNNLRQLLLLEISSMIQDGVQIRKCKNCNKYFVITDGRVAYCPRVIEGRGETTCYDVGAKEAYKRRMEKDEALSKYNRAYKTHLQRCDRNSMSRSDFEVWSSEAKSKLEEVRAGKLDIDTFKKWLKK